MEQNDKQNDAPGDEKQNGDVLAKALAALQLTGEKGAKPDAASAKRIAALLGRALAQSDTVERDHTFWNTQPVCQVSEEVKSDRIGPVDSQNDVAKVRPRPYALPDAFEWVDIDVCDEDQRTQLYHLLNENYVEDSDSMFRFDYKAGFLRWAMTPPGYKKDWLIGVRVKASKRMVGFISGIPVKLSVCGTVMEVAEINFLCVHKQLRSKRLAPVLIREVTRRVNLCNIWQAVYTAGAFITKPVATCRYWHRPLNVRKLVDSRFLPMGNRMTISRAQRLYKLPADPLALAMRPMEPADLDGVLSLLNTHLQSYQVHPIFSRDEVAHNFLPKGDNIYTYVKTDQSMFHRHTVNFALGGAVTDMLSFYRLESSVINNPKVSTVKAAYSFYNIATTVPFKQLMEKALHLASAEGFDVFNALNLMDNGPILEDLKFDEGHGNLHYYLYNWRIPSLNPSDIGLVLF